MPQGFEAFELLNRPTVVALRLGLVTEEESPGVALAGDAAEAFGEGVVAVLSAGDLQVADQVFSHGDDGVAGAVEGFVQAGGEETRFQAGGAKEGVLGEGDAFEGEQFLRVDGVIDGYEVVPETGDGLQVFEANDGVVGGGESVAAGGPVGVPAGSGFGLRAAQAGPGRPMGGASAVGCSLTGRDRAPGAGLFFDGHREDLPVRVITRKRAGFGRGMASGSTKEREYFARVMVTDQAASRWKRRVNRTGGGGPAREEAAASPRPPPVWPAAGATRHR